VEIRLIIQDKTVEKNTGLLNNISTIMMNQIAIVSDSQEILKKISECYSHTEALYFRSVESIKREDFSLLLIDYDIFGASDSIQFLLSKIRKKIHEKPVLMILREKTIHLLQPDWFFDDFIMFPFQKAELTARINRLTAHNNIDNDIMALGRLTIHFKEYTVYLDNEKLDLTYKEFELLRLLVQNKGEVFTRKDLLSKIWGMEYIGGTRTVDVHIRRLRGKLGDEFNTLIETVRNVGYRCKI
jgi:DNA-binding response OmpR family regulator